MDAVTGKEQRPMAVRMIGLSLIGFLQDFSENGTGPLKFISKQESNSTQAEIQDKEIVHCRDVLVSHIYCDRYIKS